jgi:thiol-disulfide isomerase/thioredoxin
MNKLKISLHTAWILALAILAGCGNPSNDVDRLVPGDWLFELQLDKNNPGLVLPFNVEVVDESHLIVKNASEKIKVKEIFYKDDSVHFVMPVFGSEFIGKVKGDTMRGHWHKYATTKAYKIPFTAIRGLTSRFDKKASPESRFDFSGRWKSFFIDNNDTAAAIGIFGQSGTKVTGTFLTETGDYRYLEGVADGNWLKLSTFDGAHAFLFEASMNNDGELVGFFRSGPSWQAKWLASRDESMQLGDMKSLTYLKDGYDKLTFTFPDETGKDVSLEDEQFHDKVVIVQIFGSWCPNCMDETRYLVELYNKYKDQGLEVIGLDFEPKPTLSYFKKRMERYRKDLNVDYTLLLAGHSDKQKAAEALPMLNQIISFPTAIIIDKKGIIQEIHTGFSGPGTGVEYDNYTREMENLIQNLLNE